MISKKPKAVITYLAGVTPGDVVDLKVSLSLLHKNFNSTFGYPVVIFHENFSEEIIEEIRSIAGSELQFEKVAFQIPDFLKKETIPERYYGFSIGYRHMCRFFSSDFFYHPALKEYEWYLRLDTDSFLIDTVGYDMFAFMAEHEYWYGYNYMLKDRPEVVVGFWDLTDKYVQNSNIKPYFLNKFVKNGAWDNTCYYANFEISNFNFWRSENVRSYMDFIDKSGGIYNYRWGDTIIKSLAIYLFMPEKKVHNFKDIPYAHQHFVNLPFARFLLEPFKYLLLWLHYKALVKIKSKVPL